jgi:hypothetical protein
MVESHYGARILKLFEPSPEFFSQLLNCRLEIADSKSGEVRFERLATSAVQLVGGCEEV